MLSRIQGLGAARSGAAACVDCATRHRCLMDALPDAQLPLLAPHIRTIRVRKGETIARLGDLPKAVRIVKVGQVLGLVDASGTERPVVLSGRGAVIGLFRLFDKPLALGIVATVPTTLCEIPIAVIRQLPAWPGPLQTRAAELAFTHFQNVARWSAALRQEVTAARIASCLVMLQRDSGELPVPMPSALLWSRIAGTARETASRAIARLEAEGCFVRQERMVRVDLARCEALVDGSAAEPEAGTPAPLFR